MLMSFCTSTLACVWNQISYLQNNTSWLERNFHLLWRSILPIKDLLHILFQNLEIVAIPYCRLEQNLDGKRQCIWRKYVTLSSSAKSIRCFTVKPRSDISYLTQLNNHRQRWFNTLKFQSFTQPQKNGKWLKVHLLEDRSKQVDCSIYHMIHPQDSADLWP